MRNVRKLNRRSFLGQVAGGAVGLGMLGLVGAETARAQGRPDDGDTGADRSGKNDPPAHSPGRERRQGNIGGRSAYRGDGRCVLQTGHTDADSGDLRDPAGYGNGGRPRSNFCFR